MQKEIASLTGTEKIAENTADPEATLPKGSSLKFREWLTTTEAAEYLRISAKCLLNLVSNGKILYYKFGRRNRYLESDLRKLLLANPRGGSYGL